MIVNYLKKLMLIMPIIVGLSVYGCTEEINPPVENPPIEDNGGEDGELKVIIPGGNGTILWPTPAVPNADGPAIISFRAGSTSALYNYTGDVYAHIGIIEYGTWKYVKADWGQNIDDCKFAKDSIHDNIWHLELRPSIREYFKSGDTPCTQIGIVVRSSDGASKGIEQDQFIKVSDTLYAGFQASDKYEEMPLPEGCSYGINIIDDKTITFVLHDEDTKGEHHDFAYIIGDFNNWTLANDATSQMFRDEEKDCWWITVSGLEPGKEYCYQYHIGDKSASGDITIRMADTFCEKVLDPGNDSWIPASSYTEDKTYPASGASGLVSVVSTTRESFAWDKFDCPDSEDLIIYEMHFRDFSNTKDINGALAQLDYIQTLGVNAVELMPIQEFDGNDSWGYNPCFYFALDKAYGSREMYKTFINECHKRGIAVIVDVVYNHLTGASPLAKIYWDSKNNCTAANNPYFNVSATHPFSVYHDLNHENEFVKEVVKRSTAYLLEEYNVDGFRFDLSKGLTQKQSGEDVAAWGRYDQSRVDILKGYADNIWAINEDAIVILEHLSDWDEEKVLAEYGMQLWRNMNWAYRSVITGGTGDFKDAYSNDPFGGFVAYMESHDEERLCYGITSMDENVTYGVIGLGNNWENDHVLSADGAFLVAKGLTMTATDRFKIRKVGSWEDNYNFGAATSNFKLTVGQPYEMTKGGSSNDMYVPAAGTYDVYFCPDIQTIWLMNAGDRPEDPEGSEGPKEDPLAVAMRRAASATAMFLTVPGPKMIWQFGEIGYDYSINYNDRTGQKPVVTAEYMADPLRKELYDTYSELLGFRKEHPEFFDENASFTWSPAGEIKTITTTAGGQSFHVVANFGKGAAKYTVPEGNTWKDFETGEAVTPELTIAEGDYRMLVTF